MSRILYFDCFSGASGDMLLGALLDAGLPLAALKNAIGSLPIEGYSLRADRVLRAGVSATKYSLSDHESDARRTEGEPGSHAQDHHDRAHVQEHAHDHGHEHPHHTEQAEHPRNDGHHAHRSLTEIHSLIGRSALSAAGKAKAQQLFTRLAEIEAGIHQMPVERVHLHEVGALDSIVDIVGVVFGMEWMGADTVVSSPLNVGGGMVDSAHGRFPVPAPATLGLLTGVPVYSSGANAELVTPTGALLVTGYATQYGPVPAMQVHTIGYGAGDRDPTDTPNVLRILVGDATDRAPSERILVMECEIDDMNPQVYGVLMDELHAAGALDVFLTAVQMKKNRPGTLVTIVARPADRERLSSIVFRQTTTIGLRYQEMDRERLDRETIMVTTEIGQVRVKIARRNGTVVNVTPEFDDCVRLAVERGMPVKQVQALAVKACLDRKL